MRLLCWNGCGKTFQVKAIKEGVETVSCTNCKRKYSTKVSTEPDHPVMREP